MDDIQNTINYFEKKLNQGVSKCRRKLYDTALSAIQELQQYRQIGTVSECAGYKIHSKNISNLNSCNDCGRRRDCKVVPRPGEFCRINCYLWERKKNG